MNGEDNVEVKNDDNSNTCMIKDLVEIEKTEEEEKGAFFEDILSFLRPFITEIAQKKNVEVTEFSKVISILTRHFETHEAEKMNLKKLMNVNRLIVPAITLDLPAEIILAYNKMEEDDPLVPVFRLHPLIGEEIFKFGIFLDRFDTNKEVICSLVWSTIDGSVVCLPQIGLNPYPICWFCEKHFGTKSCSKCSVAKYCSKECQTKGWNSHKPKCLDMEKLTKDHLLFPFT
eukprot:TRINITY_DN3639_c0_g2_i1.p1 TRINITY_DN3639_c0_g2~~TRINITY_DN3639_c0_g2_i1.p1  ORF type:complete len:230 (-),score=77.78 TRINITY_DN3639_c0_g2_i1:422-1111(-)